MRAIITVCYLILHTTLHAGPLKMKLSEALMQKTVVMEATNITGTFQGKTTRLNLTNLDNKNSVVVTVDLALILKPDSGAYQPMILAGEEMIVLQAGKSREVMVETFCGAHEKRCPSLNRKYLLDRVGSDTLQTVAAFVKRHGLYDDLGQTAIWATTGDYSLSYIHSTDRTALATELQALVSKVTGKPIPDYKTVMQPLDQIADAPAWTPKPLKIYASFRQILETPQILSLAVYNTDGKVIQTVFENKEFPRNGHEFEVQFEAADVPAGTYYIRLTGSGGILQEKMVQVE